MEDTEITEDGLAFQEPLPPAVNEVFSGIATELIRTRMAQVPIPEKLYHYTSASGLLGLLGKNTLWFSNSMFLNDGSETTWGINIFSRAADNYVEKLDDTNKLIAEDLKKYVESSFRYFQPIVFCMSSEDNLLNQWRDYGKDITPYCVEFSSVDLNYTYFNFPTYICEVIYDIELQIAMTTHLIEMLHNRYLEQSEITPFDKGDADSLYIAAAREIVLLLSRFKNSAFAAEKEWRMVCHEPDLRDRVKVLFRPSSLGVVPYYEWFQPGDNGTRLKLPVSHVTVGPSPYASVSDIALNQFLVETGYNGVQTHHSTIPIRRS